MSKRAWVLAALALAMLEISRPHESLATCTDDHYVKLSRPFGGPSAFSLPRPEFGAANIPLTTTFYIQLQLVNGCPGEKVDTDSITITLNGANVVLSGDLQAGYQGDVPGDAPVV